MQFKEILELGLIHPLISPCREPMIFINNKDGFWILSIDYRQLNKVTIRTQSLLPGIYYLFY